MKIPGLFHFIWAGGQKTLPNKNIKVILEWIRSNPSATFWLWVDNKTTPSEIKDFSEYYKRLFDKLNTDKIDFLSRFEIKDITEEGVVDEYIRYEIDRLRPNYGASSDMLRYAILYKFGGVYFDSDVKPGKSSLEEIGIFNEDHGRHVLFVDFDCQDKGIIGNDAFFSTEKNPLMKNLRDLVRRIYSNKSYKVYAVDDNLFLFNKINGFSLTRKMVNNVFRFLDKKTLFSVAPTINKAWQEFSQEYIFNQSYDLSVKFPIQMKAYLSDKQTYITDMTIRLTGNHPLEAVITPYQQDNESEICVKKIKKEYRTTLRELGLMWVGHPIQRCAKEIAIEIVMASIHFEVEKMKVLRLEDHVENLATAVCYSVSEAITDLLDKLKHSNINFNMAEVIQNTLRYDEIIDFYKEKRFNEKKYFHFDVNDPVKTSGIQGAHISYGILQLARIDEICTLITEKNHKVKDYINELNKIIDHGVRFITKELESLKAVWSSFSSESNQKTLFGLYRDIILKYAFEKYISLLNTNAVEPEELKASLKEVLTMPKRADIENIISAFEDIDCQINIDMDELFRSKYGLCSMPCSIN